MRSIIATLAVLSIGLSPAFAQQQKDACYDRLEGQNPNTFYNAQSTDTWRQLLQIADGQLMGQIAGVYYAEITSPDGVYKQSVYRSYEANGLFQYQDQTCGNIAGIACSQNQGTGEWRAANWSDGNVYVMIRFSDLVRTSACAGARIQATSGGFRDEFGTVWQRVK